MCKVEFQVSGKEWPDAVLSVLEMQSPPTKGEIVFHLGKGQADFDGYRVKRVDHALIEAGSEGDREPGHRFLVLLEPLAAAEERG